MEPFWCRVSTVCCTVDVEAPPVNNSPIWVALTSDTTAGALAGHAVNLPMPNTDAGWVVDADAGSRYPVEPAAEEDEPNISILLSDVACAMKTWWMSPSNVHGAPGPPSQTDTDRVRRCVLHSQSQTPKIHVFETFRLANSHFHHSTCRRGGARRMLLVCITKNVLQTGKLDPYTTQTSFSKIKRDKLRPWLVHSPETLCNQIEGRQASIL
jgi:hypothetical protein